MNDKPYDLEERTYAFALKIRLFLSNINWKSSSWTDVKQLLRSSGSVAANYIESIEAISKPDSIYRLRIAKKEAMESGLWLRLLQDSNAFSKEDRKAIRGLLAENGELITIIAAILRKKSAENPLP